MAGSRADGSSDTPADGDGNGSRSDVHGASDARVDADACGGPDARSDPDRHDEPRATALKWVGRATAETLAAAGLSAADVTEKRVSYRRLVDAGVNPGVAAKIRREYSLSWSFEAGDGLDRRSAQVRGLGEAEAAWVAASAGDWESAADGAAAGSADGSSTDPAAAPTDTGEGVFDARGTEAWRSRSRPTPLSTLPTVDGDEDAIDLLAEAGITSVRSLATAHRDRVAAALGVDRDRLDGWVAAARDAHE
ncbi:hypothetical protein GRS48_02205 [Halorubrum sp. JWXQ-INN 858]|uniref:helix-hairpin-helix domain-containing protein n=1 Tax=Halorubrum sp. JWXQ-INN 858 TaxID=2690782 RepID=UPI0013599593|nr:helix-hairpin-helix domain-containing protein [Halorubrum sp. JWXQ-INN 858]MWV63640.1 hypothetical protein [Halorubrum sp. JWXQ-INN 858]